MSGLYHEIMALTEAERADVLRRVDPISEHLIEAAFREMLDDCYGTVQIAGLEYQAADALQAVDPTAYRCAYADWLAGSDDAYIEIEGRYYGVDDLWSALEAAEDVRTEGADAQPEDAT